MSTMTTTPPATSVSRRQRIGLGLAGLLSLTSIPSALSPTPAGEVGPPLVVLWAGTVLGVVGIVAVVIAWRTGSRGALRVLAGALIFGAALSLTTALQVAGSRIPTDIIQMLPFAVVMAVLVIWGRRAKLPAALGLHYERGAR